MPHIKPSAGETSIRGVAGIVRSGSLLNQWRNLESVLLSWLISIKGFTDLLLLEYKDQLGEDVISFLEKIKEGGDKLKSLVNSFIESSQLDDKLAKLDLSREDLSDLIENDEQIIKIPYFEKDVYDFKGLIEMHRHLFFEWEK